MERVVSATEARIRFGELMRRVVEDKAPIIVERGGKPYVVVLSIEEYKQLQAAQSRETWRETLREVLQLGAQIKARRGWQPLTPPEEVIRELREERNAQLTGLR